MFFSSRARINQGISSNFYIFFENQPQNIRCLCKFLQTSTFVVRVSFKRRSKNKLNIYKSQAKAHFLLHFHPKTSFFGTFCFIFTQFRRKNLSKSPSGAKSAPGRSTPFARGLRAEMAGLATGKKKKIVARRATTVC